MLQSPERFELDNIPIALSDAQILDPYSVLENFVCDFSLGQLRTTITEMVEVCLTVDDDIFREKKKRADVLYVSRNVAQVLEAVYLITTLRRHA